MNALIERLTTWWQRPFNVQADAFSWLLTLGLIVIGLYWWHVVIKHIEPVGE